MRPEPQVQAPVEQPLHLPPDETLNRVAILVPQSGSAAAPGQSILNAAQLAITDAGGGRIHLMPYDTSRGAAVAVQQAIADGNGLILGPLLAEDVRVVAPIAQAANVPIIAFSNDVSVAGNGVYVMGLNPAQSIDRVVAYAYSRGARRFGALVPVGPYGERSAAAMRRAVERAGGTLLSSQTYDRSAASLRTAAGQLAAAGQYDAVLVADGSRVAVQAAALVRAANPSVHILGTELWATETAGGGNAQLAGAWYAAPADTLFEQLRTRYRARYTRDPYRLAALGYDAVLLAMRVAADWPLGRRFPAGAIRSNDGFIGVDGAFRFGRDGIAERALEVREVTARGTNMVSAAPRDFR
jgi:branched-chain amino acid transport system substrate-binding protein